MTKQSSKVIEQNAWSLSPLSSINLIRTSVISTAILLMKIGNSWLIASQGALRPPLQKARSRQIMGQPAL
jgi:hypothetical protein